MKFPRDLDAPQVVRALRRLGFVSVSQSGSHIKMKSGSKTVIVPNHRPIKVGTMRDVLRQAGLDLETLLENL